MSSDIYNGARCKSYCWSQSHSDLEIRINLAKMVSYEDIDVTIKSDSIRVELDSDYDSNYSDPDESSPRILMEGKFEHPVDTESASWLLDRDGPCIVIYIDKAEDLWWQKLLLNEQVTKAGPRNYTVLMNHLDDGSRMAIDRLVVEQRNKILRRNDDLSPA